MSERHLVAIGVLALVNSMALIAAAPRSQSRAASTRTPENHPDLQGVWVNKSVTPLERPKTLEGKPFLTDAELAVLKTRAARLFDVNGDGDFAGGDDLFLAALTNPERFTNPNATGGIDGMVDREWEHRTSLIVDPPDGRIPPLTSDAQRRRSAATAAARPAGPEDLSNVVRCLTFGMPRLGGNAASYNGYYQIVQTAGYVVMLSEVIHEARVIPLDGRPHLPPGVRRWQGDSRGRWDGHTLVVDTTNFSPKSNFMGSAEHLHVVERFTAAAPDTIDYEITLDDPATWTKAWTALIHLKRSQDKIYEYACHEGNFSTLTGILAAARAAEKSDERPK
jgi:hypothetical protein